MTYHVHIILYYYMCASIVINVYMCKWWAAVWIYVSIISCSLLRFGLKLSDNGRILIDVFDEPSLETWSAPFNYKVKGSYFVRLNSAKVRAVQMLRVHVQYMSMFINLCGSFHLECNFCTRFFHLIFNWYILEPFPC